MVEIIDGKVQLKKGSLLDNIVLCLILVAAGAFYY